MNCVFPLARINLCAQGLFRYNTS